MEIDLKLILLIAIFMGLVTLGLRFYISLVKREKLELEQYETEQARKNTYNEEFKRLEQEYQDLKQRNAVLAEENNTLNTQKENAQKAVIALRKDLPEAEKEFSKNRLMLSEAAKADLKLLKPLLGKIFADEAFREFIWKSYYQIPLQDMRKELFGSLTNRVSGIYKIESETTKKPYIGRSNNISTRFAEHIKDSLIPTTKFYKEMNTLGPEDFHFSVLEEVSQPHLGEREKFWVDVYAAKESGYNSTVGG